MKPEYTVETLVNRIEDLVNLALGEMTAYPEVDFTLARNRLAAIADRLRKET